LQKITVRFLFCVPLLYRVTKKTFSVGIGWDVDKSLRLQSSELELENLQINLQLVNCSNSDIYTVNLTADRKKPAQGFYMMVLTLPNITGWETYSAKMTFEHINYSWLGIEMDNKQNDEYGLGVENVISTIYKKSYVFKYFNVEVRIVDGVVFFFNLSKKQVHKADRFTVLLQIPNKTKPYFKSPAFWDATFGQEWPEWVPAQQISQIPNGTLASNHESKSHLYIPPFSVSFRSQGIEGNILSFNRFNSPNLEETILTMLIYDSATNTLLPFFDPYLTIPYKTHITLAQDLEFTILDSSRKLVHISDNSQLFFILTLL